MKAALDALLLRVQPSFRRVQIVSFDGVGNLMKSLPGQLRALACQENVRVLILRDNDNGDCGNHKVALAKMVGNAGLTGRAKVRIVCQMLEAWFIGDHEALADSGHLKKPIPKRLTRCDPDMLQDPKGELKKLRRGYGEIIGAKAIAPKLDPDRNRSASFRNTIQAISDLAAI